MNRSSLLRHIAATNRSRTFSMRLYLGIVLALLVLLHLALLLNAYDFLKTSF